MDYENFENNLQKLKNSCEKDAHAVKLEIKKIVLIIMERIYNVLEF